MQSAKDIFKLFIGPVAASFNSSFFDPISDTQFPGEPLQWGSQNTLGRDKIGDFRRKLPFISETVRDRLMVTMER